MWDRYNPTDSNPPTGLYFACRASAKYNLFGRVIGDSESLMSTWVASQGTGFLALYDRSVLQTACLKDPYTSSQRHTAVQERQWCLYYH